MNCLAILKRHIMTDWGTMGHLAINRDDPDCQYSTFRCGIVEREWFGNQVNVSCIPPGSYTVRKRDGSNQDLKYPDAWEVMSVPGRTGILFHVGNDPVDLLGCLGPNERVCYNPSTDKVSGSGSRSALDAMEAYLEGLTEFTLVIVE